MWKFFFFRFFRWLIHCSHIYVGKKRYSCPKKWTSCFKKPLVYMIWFFLESAVPWVLVFTYYLDRLQKMLLDQQLCYHFCWLLSFQYWQVCRPNALFVVVLFNFFKNYYVVTFVHNFYMNIPRISTSLWIIFLHSQMHHDSWFFLSDFAILLLIFIANCFRRMARNSKENFPCRIFGVSRT